MSYNKLGFTSGQTLKAEHLNHMEEGIANAGGIKSWNDLEDKPFEEVPKMYLATWDGDMTGRTTIDISEFGLSGSYLVKVSDEVYTEDELIGTFIHNSTEDIGYDVNNNSFAMLIAGALSINDMSVVVVHSASEINAAIGAPDGYITNGTYFLCAPSYSYYVTDICREGYVTTLDEKYLPEAAIVKHTLQDIGLRCVLDEGWSEYQIDNFTNNNLTRGIQKGMVEAIVDVDISDHLTQTCHCNFLMNNTSQIGTCYVCEGTRVIQIFMQAVPGTISVAAKTIEI